MEYLFLDNRTNVQIKCKKAHLQTWKFPVTLHQNQINMTMNKKLLTMALSLTVIPSALLAQQSATEHTIRANEAVKTELNFNDRQDYEDAGRGFIASIDGNAVLDKDGKVSYSVEEWDFLKNNTPRTANPSLWRQSQLNRINGLFEVIPGKLYQVRGFDIANMTFIRSDNGWIIIDVTTTDAAAKAGYELIKKHVGDLPVQGVIFTHPHGDHYGGIAAIKEASSKKDFDIIAPKGFMESAQNENVLADSVCPPVAKALPAPPSR